MLLAKRDELARDVGRQGVRKLLREFADRFVDKSAAVGGAGRRIDGLEREKPQHMLGVDRVRIAQPVLDVGDD